MKNSLFSRSQGLMRPLLSVLFALFLTLTGESKLLIEGFSDKALPALPDTVGRAGMMAGLTLDKDEKGNEEQVILATGGANFPNGYSWQGGKKVFHSDIYKFANNTWQKIGSLPRPLAYGAFAGTAEGLVIAGGAGENAHYKECFLVSPKGKITELPSLPKTIAYPAFVYRNSRLYVIGGQENLESTTASNEVYELNLKDLGDEKKRQDLAWKQGKPLPKDGRILATASASGPYIYVMGGASLSPEIDGSAKRTYLNEVLAYNPTKDIWVSESDLSLAPLPVTLAASPSPSPAREDKILVLGGDTGSHYGKPAETHPGQHNTVYQYDTHNNSWSEVGKLPLGLATAPAVPWQNSVYVISGETRPCVRTPLTQSLNLKYELELNKTDYLIFALVLLVCALLLFQIQRYGVKNVAEIIDPLKKPGFYAWLVVGLLWVVAMLNYFDRQLLTTIREPIVRDIPQTDMQFGMLTGVFLIIYSALSPVGGFLADKFSRRIVILCSLVVWSVVTWITGHVHDYHTLLVARALMGISEACYIPAALALITDFHRGKTRSLATGIHMSGIYAGMALAGLGGSMADAVGWRLTFGLFGLVGVAYALVLILFLKGPAVTKEELPEALALKNSEEIIALKPKLGLGYALSNILGSRAMWMLLAVVACAGAANWFLLAWFPTLLLEKFNMSLGEAGTNATLWNTVAKYVAVLGGAIIADQWSSKNPRGRSLLAAIAFCAAAPLVACSPLIPAEMTGALSLLLIFVATQGLAQGTMDATLMPIMRSYIDGRFAATGYGFLNLVSAGFGAITVIYAGKLKDMGIPLGTTLAYTGGLLLIGGLFLLFLPKPQPKPEDQN